MQDIDKWDKVTYPEVLTANVRAARAQANISQKTLAARMTVLGFNWKHQTVGKVENNLRPLFAAELLGIALACEVSMSSLLAGPEGDVLIPLTPDVSVGSVSTRRLAYGNTDRTLGWADGELAVWTVQATPEGRA